MSRTAHRTGSSTAPLPPRPARRSARRGRAARSALSLLGAGALVLGVPAVAAADPPAALPVSIAAPDGDFQPATTYDQDGCYPTPAIGADGAVATGLETTGALNGSCRDESDLDNTNSYVRAARSNGWEAYMYAYYFEKDQTTGLGCSVCGHPHDWEHVVVWVEGGQVRHVSASKHGGWETRPAADVEFVDEKHPKIVYHKDGGSTHAFRFADADQPTDNHKGTWQFPALVSWHLFPPGYRDTLTGHDFGSATLGIKDQGNSFVDHLEGAKPEGIAFDPATATM